MNPKYKGLYLTILISKQKEILSQLERSYLRNECCWNDDNPLKKELEELEQEIKLILSQVE